MKFKHLIVTALFILLSCNAQEKKDSTKKKVNTKKNTEMTTETFDIEKFNKNKINNEYNYLLEDKTKIQQMQAGHEEKLVYVEYKIPPKPEYFYSYKEYHNNGILKIKGKRFKQGAFKQGVWKKYDKIGTLIEEIDYDKPFKFTFEQLVALLKKEKDTIDLYDKNTSIVRGVVEEGTFWEVEYKKDWGRRETMVIDGITGEILERSFHPHLDN
jgi:hypothetical protein